MSRNSKANRKRRAAKEARHAKRRRTAGAGESWSSMLDLFGEEERLAVSVVRSASGRRYAEEDSIPFPDREVVAVVDDVSPADADRIANELRARIDSGEYPSDARVTVMGGWSSFSG